MVRQKVKGTGHKQPADAQTEPNFYALPPPTGSAASSPAIPQPLAPASPPPRPTSPPVAAVNARPSIMDEMSPGTAGVHGAASLLKGLASGVAPSKLSSINPNSAVPFLGPPAETFDGSKTKSIGSPMATTTQSFSMMTTYRTDDKEETENSQQEQVQGGFSSPPQPRSSYSSLLWGGGAPAPSPPVPAPSPSPAPAASFLWPHANPIRVKLDSDLPRSEDKMDDAEDRQEAV